MENNDKQPRLRATITAGELIGGIIVVIGAVLIFWNRTSVDISDLKTRMNAKEVTDQNINMKLDKLQDGINDVRLTLKDKQDRKN